MKKMLEVREYNFEGGINLCVQLDRRSKQVSFVEWDSKLHVYKPQKFLFDGRGKQYMNGWHNIFSAMQYVIKEVKKEMELWDTEETDDLVKIIEALHNVDKEIRKINEGDKAKK